MKRLLSLAYTIPEFDFMAKATIKNNLSTEQTAKEWACSKYTKWSTAFLAKHRELVIRIMYSMFILVVLKNSSLMTNSSASKVVILLAGTLKDNI